MSKFNTFNIKGSNITAANYVKGRFDHQCECGNSITVELDWPENLTVNGIVTVSGQNCPSCGASIILPAAHYRVEGGRLLSSPLGEVK